MTSLVGRDRAVSVGSGATGSVAVEDGVDVAVGPGTVGTNVLVGVELGNTRGRVGLGLAVRVAVGVDVGLAGTGVAVALFAVGVEDGLTGGMVVGVTCAGSGV